jgi:DNA-binding response OmpR family regulator
MIAVVIVVGGVAVDRIESVLMEAGWETRVRAYREEEGIDRIAGDDAGGRAQVRTATIAPCALDEAPRLVRHVLDYREGRRTPIILVVGDPGEAATRRGIRRALRAGASDFIAAASVGAELTLRLTTIARRTRPAPSPRQQAVGDLVLERTNRQLRHGENVVKLTPNEYKIFSVLARQPDVPVSREALKRHLGYTSRSTSANLIDVYVLYLRRKLQQLGCRAFIRTVRLVGYALVTDAPVITSERLVGQSARRPHPSDRGGNASSRAYA